MKRRSKIVQEITLNIANVFSFYAIIAIEHSFTMHEHSPGPEGGVENIPFMILGEEIAPWPPLDTTVYMSMADSQWSMTVSGNS